MILNIYLVIKKQKNYLFQEKDITKNIKKRLTFIQKKNFLQMKKEAGLYGQKPGRHQKKHTFKNYLKTMGTPLCMQKTTVYFSRYNFLVLQKRSLVFLEQGYLILFGVIAKQKSLKS